MSGAVIAGCRRQFAAWRLRGLVVWVALCCSAVVWAQAPSDLRVAVVIGNSTYPDAPLANPVNDARAVGDTLRDLGFVVIEVRNGGKAQMQAAVTQAAAMLKGQNGVGLFYFAGHGVQQDWHNYLLPVDAQVKDSADVQAQAINLQSVMDAFRIAGNRVTLVILDACRDNPFVGGPGRKGLAPMDAPQGALLAYATAPGSVAEDGDSIDGNGLYTHHLVQAMKQAHTKVEDVFKRVRVGVRKQSHGRQIPWENTSLEDDFYFDPKVRVAAIADLDTLAREKADWALIERSLHPLDFELHLRKYPDGALREHAQSYLEELRAQSARSPGARGSVQLPDPANHYATGDTFELVLFDGYANLGTRVLRRVTFADNARAELDGGRFVFTQEGGVIRDTLGSYDPPRQDRVADLHRGKAWRSSFTLQPWRGPSLAVHCDYKVVAFEEITVPAGTFKAFKIERTGSSLLAPPGLSARLWYDPAAKVLVRVDTLVRGSQVLGVWESAQLVGVRLAKRRASP